MNSSSLRVQTTTAECDLVSTYTRAHPSDTVRFRSIANLFTPATIDAAVQHDGTGVTPGIKREDGGWDTSGHASRIIEVDHDADLAAFAKLFDSVGTPAMQARLPAVHSESWYQCFKSWRLCHYDFGDCGDDYFPTECWHESNAQRNGTIRRSTGIRGLCARVHTFWAAFLGRESDEQDAASMSVSRTATTTC